MVCGSTGSTVPWFHGSTGARKTQLLELADLTKPWYGLWFQWCHDAAARKKNATAVVPWFQWFHWCHVQLVGVIKPWYGLWFQWCHDAAARKNNATARQPSNHTMVCGAGGIWWCHGSNGSSGATSFYVFDHMVPVVPRFHWCHGGDSTFGHPSPDHSMV